MNCAGNGPPLNNLPLEFLENSLEYRDNKIFSKVCIKTSGYHYLRGSKAKFSALLLSKIMNKILKLHSGRKICERKSMADHDQYSFPNLSPEIKTPYDKFE